MADPRPDNVEPIPDLADLPVAPPPAAEPDSAGKPAEDTPAEDLTLPTE